MEINDKILVTGAKGQLGSAVVRNLKNKGYHNVIAVDYQELDLYDHAAVEAFFEKERPDYVFFYAAFIGGIEFKKEHPAEIFTKNMQMTLNVFENARKFGVRKLLNTATALVYPNDAPVPTPESCISQVKPAGPDAPYTLVKFSGKMLCDFYRSQYGCRFFTVIPCNFYGPNAPFEGNKAGVVPSLIRKMHEAKTNGSREIEVWGTGNAGRDFLAVDDVADACVFLMESYDGVGPVNIGSGKEITIKEAAEIIRTVTGFEGKLVFDASKPEGRQHMLLDTSLLNGLGWHPSHSFAESVKVAYDWYWSEKLKP